MGRRAWNTSGIIMANLIARSVRILFAFASIGISGCTDEKPSTWRQQNALPPLDTANCVPPTQDELPSFELAISVLENEARAKAEWLATGARRFLGFPYLRTASGKAAVICAPDDLYARVEAAIVSSRLFSRGRLTESDLSLAYRLENPSGYVVDAIAASAFNEVPQESEIFKTLDLRPQFRAVLASFGRKASKYADRAFGQISADDAMGTGAAQVAAAGQHPQALTRISELMRTKLSELPAEAIVPRDTRLRLYELAWAIYFSGSPAKQHVEPIKMLMKRKVESLAPPFGLVDARPKQMCRVLSLIEGEASISAFPYCHDQGPMEQ